MPIVLQANFPHASCPPCQLSACQLSSMPIVRMPIVLHANCPHASCPPCQLSACQLSSMPIVRMPVVLHANCPHANRPHANCPHANRPATVSLYAWYLLQSVGRVTLGVSMSFWVASSKYDANMDLHYILAIHVTISGSCNRST